MERIYRLSQVLKNSGIQILFFKKTRPRQGIMGVEQGAVMNIKEKTKIKEMLDRKVDTYFEFLSRDDYPEKPCVRKAVDMLQNAVFTLAEFLCNCSFITWEECCEYWSKVGFVDDFNESCQDTKCRANINGICKYAKSEKGGNE